MRQWFLFSVMVAAGVLGHSACADTLYGEVDDLDDSSTRLFGGISAMQSKGKTLMLQAQQPRFDLSVRTSLIRLVQRQVPQVNKAYLMDPLMPPEPLQAPPPIAPPPPLPVLMKEQPSSIDPVMFKQRADAFEAKCRVVMAHWSADVAQLNQEADENLKELRARSTGILKKWESESEQRREVAAKEKEKLSEMETLSRESLLALELKVASRKELREAQLAKMKERTEELREEMTGDKGPIPTNVVPLANFGEEDARQEIGLPWDQWYKGMAAAVKDPLLKAVAQHGNPAGNNTVMVTVTADGRIAVQLQKSSNPQFDDAVLEAYQSLDFNPALEFPKGSRRKVVSYLTDHKHTAAGEAVDIDAHELKGDVEKQLVGK